MLEQSYQATSHQGCEPALWPHLSQKCVFDDCIWDTGKHSYFEPDPIPKINKKMFFNGDIQKSIRSLYTSNIKYLPERSLFETSRHLCVHRAKQCLEEWILLLHLKSESHQFPLNHSEGVVNLFINLNYFQENKIKVKSFNELKTYF